MMMMMMIIIIIITRTSSETEFIYSRIQTDERVIEFLVSLQIEGKNRP